MTASNIHYEIANCTRTTAHGGLGTIPLMVRKLGLDQAINERLGLLKLHPPYHDSNHVLNIAYNLLAGGTCLEHLELRGSDEAYLDVNARCNQEDLLAQLNGGVRALSACADLPACPDSLGRCECRFAPPPRHRTERLRRSLV